MSGQGHQGWPPPPSPQSASPHAYGAPQGQPIQTAHAPQSYPPGAHPGHGAHPHPQAYGAQYAQGVQTGYGAQPAPSAQPGYGAQPVQAPQLGYGAQPMQAPQPGYGGPPVQAPQLGYGAQPMQAPQPGYGAQPMQAPQLGYGAQPMHAPQTGYGAQPAPSAQLGQGAQPMQAPQLGHGVQPVQQVHAASLVSGASPAHVGQPAYGGPASAPQPLGAAHAAFGPTGVSSSAPPPGLGTPSSSRGLLPVHPAYESPVAASTHPPPAPGAAGGPLPQDRAHGRDLTLRAALFVIAVAIAIALVFSPVGDSLKEATADARGYYSPKLVFVLCVLAASVAMVPVYFVVRLVIGARPQP